MPGGQSQAVGGAAFDAGFYAWEHRNEGFSWKGLLKAATRGAITGVALGGVGKLIGGAIKGKRAVKVTKSSGKANKLKINLQLFGKGIEPHSSVKEILKHKKGSIKNAPIEKGGPSWDEIQNMTIDEINKNAQKGIPGFKTIRKLLTDKRFDR